MEERNEKNVIFKCSKCKRVCTNIEDDGICGSPICRKDIE